MPLQQILQRLSKIAAQDLSQNKPSKSPKHRKHTRLMLLGCGAGALVGVTLPLAVIKDCRFIQLSVETPIGKGELTIKDKLDRF
jgi:hypothetical protein